MNTVYARALVALALVALPASALASTKGEAKVSKVKHEAKASHDQPRRAHASLAKKEHSTKKSKHHGHQAKDGKALATAEPGSNTKAH